jgi:hypothetical protein
MCCVSLCVYVRRSGTRLSPLTRTSTDWRCGELRHQAGVPDNLGHEEGTLKRLTSRRCLAWQVGTEQEPGCEESRERPQGETQRMPGPPQEHTTTPLLWALNHTHTRPKPPKSPPFQPPSPPSLPSSPTGPLPRRHLGARGAPVHLLRPRVLRGQEPRALPLPHLLMVRVIVYVVVYYPLLDPHPSAIHAKAPADLMELVDPVRQLPPLTPSRHLWSSRPSSLAT